MLNLTLLDTVDKCNVVIAEFEKIRDDLQFKQESTNRSNEALVQRNAKHVADLAAVQAEKTAVNNILSTLTAGDPIHTEMSNRLVVLDFEEWKLQQGTSATYDKVLISDLAKSRIADEIANVNTNIAAVTTHRDSL